LNDQNKVTKEKSPATEKFPKIIFALVQENNSPACGGIKQVFLPMLRLDNF
jgi:hypothetical protein